MGDGAITDLPDNGVCRDLIAKYLADELSRISKSPAIRSRSKSWRIITVEIDPRHRDPRKQSVGFSLQELSEGASRSHKGKAVPIGVVRIHALTRIGQRGPIHLLIFIDGPGLLQTLVAPLLELVLVIRPQVIHLDRQFPAKDI